jgi:hypothetical protein
MFMECLVSAATQLHVRRFDAKCPERSHDVTRLVPLAFGRSFLENIGGVL